MHPLNNSIKVFRPKHIKRKREAKVAKKFITPIKAVMVVEEISRPLKRILE
jgi:hypothetical protein